MESWELTRVVFRADRLLDVTAGYLTEQTEATEAVMIPSREHAVDAAAGAEVITAAIPVDGAARCRERRPLTTALKRRMQRRWGHRRAT